MNTTFFDFKNKAFQINLGFVLIVIWKTCRWHVSMYIKHRRFAI